MGRIGELLMGRCIDGWVMGGWGDMDECGWLMFTIDFITDRHLRQGGMSP